MLDDERRKIIVDTLKIGVPIHIACGAANVSESAYKKWMREGREEWLAREDGEEPDPAYDQRVALFLEAQQARASAAVRNVGVIQKAAQGGAITEETTERYWDAQAKGWVEKKTVKKAPPDWRASAWYLERSHQADFSKAANQVEVTGAGGGAIQVDHGDLAARLSAHLAAGVAVLPALEAQAIEDGDDEMLAIEAAELDDE